MICDHCKQANINWKDGHFLNHEDFKVSYVLHDYNRALDIHTQETKASTLLYCDMFYCNQCVSSGFVDAAAEKAKRKALNHRAARAKKAREKWIASL